MKHIHFILWILSFALLSAGSRSQEVLPPKDQNEIRYLSRKKIEADLVDLLNTLSFNDLSEFERKTLIENSYLPNPNQVFFDEAAIVEDDLNGSPKASGKPVDLEVSRYLKNFDLYYQKQPELTVQAAGIFASEVKRGKDHWYVQVFFQIIYKSRHTNKTKFNPMWRVAELRADKIEKQWVTLISRISFFDPQSTKSTTQTISAENLKKKIVEDSLANASLTQAYGLRLEELLTLGDQIIKNKNDKPTAIDYFTQAKFLDQRYQLGNKRLVQLYQLYMNKGEIIQEAEIYDKALAWYEVAQALNDSEEIRQKINECKKQLKN